MFKRGGSRACWTRRDTSSVWRGNSDLDLRLTFPRDTLTLTQNILLWRVEFKEHRAIYFPLLWQTVKAERDKDARWTFITRNQTEAIRRRNEVIRSFKPLLV